MKLIPKRVTLKGSLFKRTLYPDRQYRIWIWGKSWSLVRELDELTAPDRSSKQVPSEHGPVWQDPNPKPHGQPARCRCGDDKCEDQQ